MVFKSRLIGARNGIEGNGVQKSQTLQYIEQCSMNIKMYWKLRYVEHLNVLIGTRGDPKGPTTTNIMIKLIIDYYYCTCYCYCYC